MRVGGERDTFDPDGLVMFQFHRKAELLQYRAGDSRIDPPATGVEMPIIPGRGTRAWHNSHLNLTRSLADVDAERQNG